MRLLRNIAGGAFAGAVTGANIGLALWLGYAICFCAGFTILDNTHNEEPWLTNGEIAAISAVDTTIAIVVALVASKVLSMLNRVAKLPAPIVASLRIFVFLSITIGLATGFFRGFASVFH